jgi:hypothetical protein
MYVTSPSPVGPYLLLTLRSMAEKAAITDLVAKVRV